MSRILFPFVGSVLSERTLEATLRLAKAQDATLMPAYIALIPRTLSLEVPLGAECDDALALLEAVEQRAARAGVPVDSRIVRGRTTRQAIAELVDEERFDTLVIPARSGASDGFEPRDIAWVLESAPSEVLVLRPERAASAAAAI
jgi:nucleotide-binding universal stress UspA family protein